MKKLSFNFFKNIFIFVVIELSLGVHLLKRLERIFFCIVLKPAPSLMFLLSRKDTGSGIDINLY